MAAVSGVKAAEGMATAMRPQKNDRGGGEGNDGRRNGSGSGGRRMNGSNSEGNDRSGINYNGSEDCRKDEPWWQ